MCDKLNNLKKEGYYPNIIIDIGAYHRNWTKSILEIYKESKYYLFEIIKYDELDIFKESMNIKVINAVLNDKEEVIDLYQEKNTGYITLNSIIEKENIHNIFIKIDCQGADIPILKSSSKILNKTDFILIEIPLFEKYKEGVSNFLEYIQFMDTIGFIPFDICDNNSMVMLFIRKTSNFYFKFLQKPLIHSIMLSNYERRHVINYIKEKKKKNPSFKVIDIGGSADYTNWSCSVIDYIADMNEPTLNNSKIKYFKLNINFENDFKELLNYVNKNGKFDFCICSHIIEDIALPQVILNNLKNIAKEGFIGIPSKYRELSKINGNFLGYVHHRWIYSIKKNELIGFPKLNFIDQHKGLIDIGNRSKEILDLSFFWKNSVTYSIINNDYMGPCAHSVVKYYNELLIDDLDEYKKINNNIYHIEFIKNKVNIIHGEFIYIIMLIENIIDDLKIMENYGFIPFQIIDKRNITGKIDLMFLFINKTNEFNKRII